MVIVKKPSLYKKNVESNIKINAIISKGGTAASECQEHEIKKTELRIPLKIYNEIESSMSKEIIKKSRNTWILEAIYAKLNSQQD